MQVGNIERMLCKTCLEHDKITLNWQISTLCFDDALKFILNSRNLEFNYKLKILNVQTILSHFILSITCNNCKLSYLGILCFGA